MSRPLPTPTQRIAPRGGVVAPAPPGDPETSEEAECRSGAATRGRAPLLRRRPRRRPRARPGTNRPRARTDSATAASGETAALSIRPSRKMESATAPKLAVRLRHRRTTATRITSSQRPGRAIPPTDAAPPAAASVRTAGRCSVRNRRCQPHAFASVRAEEDDCRETDQPEVGPVERPAAQRAMTCDERGHDESDQHETDVEEALESQGVNRYRQRAAEPHPSLCSVFVLRCGVGSRMPPSADVSSLGITHTLLASPCAICGNTCRYW